jgi:beta-glucosidase
VTPSNSGPYTPRPSPSPPPPEPSLSQETYTFPPGFSSVKNFIYPYLKSTPTSSSSVSSTMSTSSTASPFPYSPAGGAPGGNPSLYDTLYTVSATITNTGNRQGKEVVQLYITFPSSVGEPPCQLRGFEKIDLQPGESQTVSFDVVRKDLSYWNVTSQNWLIANGSYIFYVGRSSRDMKLQETINVS